MRLLWRLFFMFYHRKTMGCKQVQMGAKENANP
nr:MAG TPA: hypothetical protein [Caudoviricetes sp.]